MNRRLHTAAALIICLLLASCGSDEPQTETTAAGFEASTFTESVSIPETDGSNAASENSGSRADGIKALTENGLSVCSPDESYDWAVGEKDFYAEASEKYMQLLESFADFPEKYEIFGGAFFQNGYLHLLITDKERSNEFLDTVGNEDVIVKECRYSYQYLRQVYDFIGSFELNSENGPTSYILSENKNRVLVTVLSENAKAYMYTAVGNAGFDSSAVEITAADYVWANPL